MKDGSGLKNQLKAIRTRLGLSQQELATAAGIARQTIGGIEAELYAPSAAIALRLAKALGCRVEEIFWLEDESPTVQAALAGADNSIDASARVALARVGERWVAHSLQGAAAFRSEMVPADGIGVGVGAGGENTVAVRLLDEPDTLARTVVVAGCTPVLSLWARSAERWHPGLRVHWVHANSTAALESLARGDVHAAGVHLYDPATGECNVSFVRHKLAGRAAVLVSLGIGEEGFVVASGNPKRLRGVSDLAQAGVTLINREVGAGSRLMLDAALADANLTGATIRGYENTVGSHQAVAMAVASGQADAGVTTAGMARTFGLGFVPLRLVRYDLALLEASLHQEPVRQLLSTLQHRWVRSQLALLGGYDTTHTGETTVIAPTTTQS